MKMRKELLSMLIILGFSAFLQACDEGPMEDAGENIDEAADEVADEVDDAF